MPMQNGTFYSNGLRFSCTECSLCCRFDSGYVFLSEADLDRLSAHFTMTRAQLIERYCLVVHVGVASRVTLKEQKNLDCVFWKNGGCSVYDARPLQCRSFPFWPTHLNSRQDWDDLEKECPGINVGRLHSGRRIEQWVDARREEPLFDPVFDSLRQTAQRQPGDSTTDPDR